MLVSEDRLEHALALAYRDLNRRDRTEAEVRRRLERDSLEAQVIDRAICALKAQGYVDDVRFARLYVQEKRELEQWGGERIGRTLLARGIDTELVAAALDEQSRESASGEELPDGEFGRALAVLRRRFPIPPSDRRQRERALGVLLRKGYDSELALEALASYAHETSRPRARESS